MGTSNGLQRWDDGKVSLFGSQTGKHAPDGKLNGLSPNTLFKDSSGRMWVSTSRDFGYLENARFVPVAGFPGGYVHSIVEDKHGHIWVEVQQTGLVCIFRGRIIRQIPWTGLGHKDFPMAMAADPSSPGIWLGFGQGGVDYVEDGRVRASYSADQGLGKGMVNELRFGPRASLWAATDGGLSRIKDGQITTLTSKNGLPCNAVQWTMRDDDNSVWLNMSCGLVRVAQSELDAWATDPKRTVKVTVFDSSDGVQSRAHRTGFGPRATKSTDGKIWFATVDGVSIIDPHHLAFNKLPPPVHIEQVTADDKTYDATNGLRLPPHVRYLAIDYTALSLVAPEKVRFRYKLEGEDKDWREVVNDRQVQYTNLPPKHYRFRVLACNNSGVWNEQGASLEFVIPPAWYQTNWFYALCAAMFLLLLWGLYNLRVLQLQREFNAALEARVGERTRVARELHDTLLQSFHGLLLRFQTVFQLLPERPIEAKERLGSAIDQAAEAITEGRDAVQGLRDSVVQKNDLALAISTLGEELVTASTNHRPAFGVAVEGDSRDLHPIIRDEIYKVAAEALRNTFRHAGAKHVEVEIRYDNDRFRLRVRDDGKGIDTKVLAGDGREGHYGMHGMRERTEVIGGKLEIWSQLNAGTEVELTIPANLAYAGSRRLAWLTQRLARKESGD
jgi:signal transduction histidine kinase